MGLLTVPASFGPGEPTTVAIGESGRLTAPLYVINKPLDWGQGILQLKWEQGRLRVKWRGARGLSID